MANNSLTGLIPSIYASLDIISREIVGALGCVTRDPSMERAAVGQTVTIFTAPKATATDITPAVTPPDDGEQTFGNLTMTLTKARRVPFRWKGEEERGLNNGGPGAAALKASQMTQAFRTLVNEMELDVVNEIRARASRAYGTAGTTPFASGVGDSAQMKKILDDNGAPATGRASVIDTTAGAALRTNTQLTKANEAGTILTLRSGEILNLHGSSYHESAQVGIITPGTGASYTTNTAGYAVGATAITLITGTGTILPGDPVTFAGDSNKYIALSFSGGILTLAGPGLRKAIPTSATAVTVSGLYTPNMYFCESAVQFASRAPALPDGGDSAVDRMLVTDPFTGITFEISMYAQYRQMQYEVAAVWGVKNIKPEHTAILLG